LSGYATPVAARVKFDRRGHRDTRHGTAHTFPDNRQREFAEKHIQQELEKKKKQPKKKKTYNSRYSLVVTDPATNQPIASLTLGEQTGSRIF
jgi:hypothetical protein